MQHSVQSKRMMKIELLFLLSIYEFFNYLDLLYFHSRNNIKTA